MTAEEFKNEMEKLQPILVSVAERYLHNKEDAEDIVQDVSIKLWEILEELRLPLAPLARILTRNFCINHIRQHPDLQELDTTKENRFLKYPRSESYDAVTSPEETSPQQEMIDRMMQSIEHLPSKQQLVIRLRHMDGMSTAEIAQLTGDSEANVRQTLCRARQAIRKLYLKTRL